MHAVDNCVCVAMFLCLSFLQPDISDVDFLFLLYF